jgi:toxin FitB
VRFLLDTCLLSELVKPTPHPGVLAWLQDQDETGLHVCAITLAELERGVARLPASRRKNALAEWLASVKLQFSSRVLAFTGDTADVCAGRGAGQTDGRL